MGHAAARPRVTAERFQAALRRRTIATKGDGAPLAAL